MLSDRETRAIYDQHGEEGVRRHRAGAGQQQQGFPGGVQFDFGGFSFSFGDDAAQKEVKGDDVVVELSVTLEDLYNGQEFALHREKAVFVETSGFRRGRAGLAGPRLAERALSHAPMCGRAPLAGSATASRRW